MINRGKKNLLGVAISAVDYDYAVDRIMTDAKAGRRCATTALAVHGVMTGALNREHRYRLNSFDLVTPDGQPVRWALNRLYGTKLLDRVYGPKMTLLVCKRAAQERVPIYLYGSRPEILEKLQRQLRNICPGLQIAGVQPSKFRLLSIQEQTSVAECIRDSGARILFVGLGCPRQEVFTYEMSHYLNMPVLAVGAAFDYHSGLLKEPPEFLQLVGLQWVFRLAQEPGRLWRRYLITNSQFVALLCAQWLRLWRPKLSDVDRPVVNVRYG
jgi:N-acetylglucosaminyldiphosphoundecaprenol N-acetyl-beta-D-mannosaminyltransferase